MNAFKTKKPKAALELSNSESANQQESTDLMELDLLGENCLGFDISSSFEISEETYSRLEQDDSVSFPSMDDVEQPGVMRGVVFGSSYNSSDAPIRVRGFLARDSESSQVKLFLHVGYSVGNLNQPIPEETPSISSLFEVCNRLFYDIPLELDCYANFSYELGEGLTSRVSLPSPLLIADESSSDALTHIEGVIFSRRENDEPTHTVLVEPGADGRSIVHHVTFTTNISDGALDQNRVREMFQVAGRLSISLLDRQ